MVIRAITVTSTQLQSVYKTVKESLSHFSDDNFNELGYIATNRLQNTRPLFLALFSRERGKSYFVPVQRFQPSDIGVTSVSTGYAVFHRSKKLL